MVTLYREVGEMVVDRNSKVLDVGAGTGTVAQELVKVTAI